MGKRWHDVPRQDGPFTGPEEPRTSPEEVGDHRGPVDLHPFRMGDEELPFFDTFATEQARIAGTPLRYYRLDPDGGVRDPLYDEPAERAFKGPFELVGVVEKPSSFFESREWGGRHEISGGVWISRREFEDTGAGGFPREGDVVEFWDLPFFEDWSTGRGRAEGAGYFFDVTQVSDEGHIFDGPAFVGFRLDLRRSTAFTPERKIFGDRGENC